jgi:hypothetical protein
VDKAVGDLEQAGVVKQGAVIEKEKGEWIVVAELA